MLPGLRRWLSLAWLGWLLACCGRARPAERPPDLAELRSLLLPLRPRRFDEAAQQRGCPADQDLGQYLDLLARTTSPDPAYPDEIRRLTGACSAFPEAPRLAPVDPPADPAYWYCRIEAFASDRAGESPWRYELRLRVRRSDRSIDAAHLSCPGAS